MIDRPFGPSGVSASMIGEGTWNMELDDRGRAIAAIRKGLDLGVTHVDTAEMYGNGEVEEIVGEAIEGRRDEVFLVSKVLPHHASRKGTIAACEASLRRLATDHLDCYLLHWPGEHPFAETLAGFQDLVRAGKIRTYGVSNFDDDELAEAVRLAGPGRIACNQVGYHLKDRRIERAVLPACEKYGVALVGYSPFGSGDFPAAASRGGRVLADVARSHGATPRQVALAFLIRHRMTLTIPKASKTRHVEENAEASRFELTTEDVARIDEAFPVAT